jgi:acetylornithine deacetylase/succinyl-diaminopimelate desuccinylase-like protein
MTISRAELIEGVNDDNGLVDLLTELLKIPSDNPPGDTTAIAAFISEYLKRYSVDAEIQPRLGRSGRSLPTPGLLRMGGFTEEVQVT